MLLPMHLARGELYGVDMTLRAGNKREVAIDKRRGARGVAVVEIARCSVAQGPALAAIGIEAAEDIDPIGRIAVRHDDDIARRRDARDRASGHSPGPNDGIAPGQAF